jgi:hypothetical protein
VKKVLIIYDSIDYFIPIIRKKGLLIYSSYNINSFFKNKLFSFFRRFRLPLSLFFNRWKYDLDNIEVILIFLTTTDKYLLNYFSINYPNKRIILWFWNPLFRHSNFPISCKSNIESWSFDQNDCKKYNLRFNTSFYFSSIKLPENKIIYDIFFVGKDKGRSFILNELEKKIEALGLIAMFYVVSDDTKKTDYYKKTTLSYNSILLYISKCKAILDITQEGQHGISLRPLEALFFKKKLITNNVDILRYDFYHPDNIFILGKDDILTLNIFLMKPIADISQKIIDLYEFDSWINRFNIHI